MIKVGNFTSEIGENIDGLDTEEFSYERFLEFDKAFVESIIEERKKKIKWEETRRNERRILSDDTVEGTLEDMSYIFDYSILWSIKKHGNLKVIVNRNGEAIVSSGKVLRSPGFYYTDQRNRWEEFWGFR